MIDQPENPDEHFGDRNSTCSTSWGSFWITLTLLIDQKLERIVETLNGLDIQLLQAVSKFSTREMEEAFDTFLTPREHDETIQLQNLLIAIACAAEFKRRADQIGLTVMEYARRIRVRRELDNV